MSSDRFIMSVHWESRTITLREYADQTRSFLCLLKSLHPIFAALEWSGKRAHSAVRLLPDLRNLEALIHDNIDRGRRVYQNANPDGSPSWTSTCDLGFLMTYQSIATSISCPLDVMIGAGNSLGGLMNSVSITFPTETSLDFPYSEFHDYRFVKELFCNVIGFWKPAVGRVSSFDFYRAFSEFPFPLIGWFTYVRDASAPVLRDDPKLGDFLIEAQKDGGVLISLDNQVISPFNEEQLDKARRLQKALASIARDGPAERNP